VPTAATGPLAGPLDALRELVALSTTFQAAVGAADEAEALEHVYGVAKEEYVRPFAIVYEPDSEEMSLAVGEFGPAEIEFRIEFPIEDTEDDDDEECEAFVKFANTVADIRREMMAAATGGDGTLFVRSIRMTESPMRTDPRREGGEQGYSAAFRVSCGLEG
jgi:hypothetical protein